MIALWTMTVTVFIYLNQVLSDNIYTLEYSDFKSF